jgi:hypothetical protein
MRKARESRTPTYVVRFYYLAETMTEAFGLFKRVYFPGRRRPETFAFDGHGWRPASGWMPAASGTYEWDAAAIPLPTSAARELVARETGWPEERIDRLFAGQEGQRLMLRA